MFPFFVALFCLVLLLVLVVVTRLVCGMSSIKGGIIDTTQEQGGYNECTTLATSRRSTSQGISTSQETWYGLHLDGRGIDPSSLLYIANQRCFERTELRAFTILVVGVGVVTIIIV